MNAGDVIFQLIMFLFIFGMFFVVFFVVRSLITKQQQPNKSDDIEQKLDRIIEILEQDKK
ncbi:DUF4083 family protein [Metabacillus niabensis]|uniref:DUF4083 family protein n=1 Tax=Metabacillus niabensis TaxID=324854 RepID=UPI001CFBB0FB|nr:DUF4083 family protein [Metabacillus niabensis]